MKSHAPSLVLKPAWVPSANLDQTECRGTEPSSVRPLDRPAAPQLRRGGFSQAVRLVGYLAVGHSLLFIVIWLFMCAHLGAAEVKPEVPELRLSAYEPEQPRDPFLAPGLGVTGAATAPVGANELKLQGILFHPTRPSAMVNNKLVMLDRPVMVRTVVGEVEVKATEITRNIVRLEVGSDVIELSMTPTTALRSEAPENTSAGPAGTR